MDYSPQAAIDRAKDLLFAYLRPSQREQVDQTGWFIENGYRINAAYGTVDGHCILTTVPAPAYDLALSMLIRLRTGDDRARMLLAHY